MVSLCFNIAADLRTGPEERNKLDSSLETDLEQALLTSSSCEDNSHDNETNDSAGDCEL